MFEFMTGLIIYLCVLLGIYQNETDINLLKSNIQFTATVVEEDASRRVYTSCNNVGAFLPTSSKAEVLKDTDAYSEYPLQGETIRLYESKFVQVIAISDDGSICVIGADGKQWYVLAEDLLLETSSILGTPISVVIPDDTIPPMFIANTDNCNVKQLYGMYRLIPNYIQKSLEKDGWTLEVTDEDLQEKFDRDTPVAGITVHAEKRIYIKNTASTITYCTYHEIGHAIDAILKYPSLTKEFTEIYEEEKASFHAVGLYVDDYEKTDVKEYWACTVNNILLTANRYEDSAPRTYEYVRRYLCRMKKNAQ